MSQHTAGPWHQHNGRIGHPSNYDVRIRVGPPGEAGVADVWAGGTSRPLAEQEANARLIAAAPDLLTACLRLIETGCSGGSDFGESVWDAAVTQAEAAIAKATGEPQP